MVLYTIWYLDNGLGLRISLIQLQFYQDNICVMKFKHIMYIA